jgi:hypothetical protein
MTIRANQIEGIGNIIDIAFPAMQFCRPVARKAGSSAGTLAQDGEL